MILIGRKLNLNARSKKKRSIDRSVRESFDVQLSGCRKAKYYLTAKAKSGTMHSVGNDAPTSSQFPVIMTKGSHLFPSRTQKLSPSVPKVLGWTRPGRIGRCRIPFREVV